MSDRQTDSSGGASTPVPSRPAEYPPGYAFAPQYQAEHQREKICNDPSELPPIPNNVPLGKLTLDTAVFAAFVVGCLVNLVLGAMVGPGEPALLLGVSIAALLSQLALVSLGIVWGSRPHWQRQVAGTVSGWLLISSLVVGFKVGNTATDFFEQARIAICCLPLIMLSAQVPLWALRTYFRWRILPKDRPAVPDRPLTIGDVIAATIVVALAFGFIRLASDDPDFYRVAWIGWLIAIPSIAAVSLVSLPPLLYLMLRRNAWPVGGFLAWCGYMTVLLTIYAIIISLFVTRWTSEGVLVLFLATLGAGTLTWLACCGLRACGYRLVIGGEPL